VNLDRRANRQVAQVVSFLEKSVHSTFLHQANEGNEELSHGRRSVLHVAPAVSVVNGVR